jgi:hypothetical protein
MPASCPDLRNAFTTRYRVSKIAKVDQCALRRREIMHSAGVFESIHMSLQEVDVLSPKLHFVHPNDIDDLLNGSFT